jgi:organic hydroperoxide reductase OsmC/OhrA
MADVAEYTASVVWERNGSVFTDNRYSRGHRWKFDGGIEVPGSSSPHSVPLPLSVAEAVDPEEAFVAAISSCHMLWFLSLAAKRGLVVDSYRDDAVGVMGRDANRKIFVSAVTLHPRVVIGGDKGATADELAAIHHEAHEACYIANSIRTEVRCEPVAPGALNA